MIVNFQRKEFITYRADGKCHRSRLWKNITSVIVAFESDNNEFYDRDSDDRTCNRNSRTAKDIISFSSTQLLVIFSS